jgi:hypothetical protein
LQIGYDKQHLYREAVKGCMRMHTVNARTLVERRSNNNFDNTWIKLDCW